MESQKTNRPVTANNKAPVNAFTFTVESMIKSRVNTALPVIVTDVDAGGAGSATGYVTVKPLVCTRDADNNVLDPTELFHVPYMRYQGGVVAVVCDPCVGDIGLAVFAQQDASNVTVGTEKPVQPGSFRYFDMADGFYIGGFLNRAPTCYVELEQSGNITIKAPSGVRIESPTVEITGHLVVHNTEGSGGSSSMTGGITNTGGEIVSNGIVLEAHVHGGVETGSGSTGTPIG